MLGEDANKLVHTLSKKKKQFGPIIELSENKFGDFLDRNRQCTYKDTTLILNGLYYLKTNKILLSTKSKYFANLFSGRYKEKNEIGIDL